jgi:hypothetical protein
VATFCRHGTLTDSCPICRPSVENAERDATQRPARARPARSPTTSSIRPRTASAGRSGRLVIRHETRAADDGFRSHLAPGLRSTVDAERLAEALAGAGGRIERLSSDPPGLYLEVAAGELEEASWLAFLISLIGPLEEADDPFASVEAARTSWASGEPPRLEDVEAGPRGSLDRSRALETVLAYRRWVDRAGSQRDAYGGDPAWTPAQRFERVFERLALPAFERRARFDLLVVLGATGRYPLSAPGLLLVEDDSVSRAAKRVFGIGDRMTLERRARELAVACGAPVAALDLALDRWSTGSELAAGVPLTRDESVLERARSALGID